MNNQNTHHPAPNAGVQKTAPSQAGGILDAVARLFLRRCCNLQVDGVGAIPDGPFMVCTNHRSHADSIVIMAALGLPFSRCGLIAAQDYFFVKRSKASMASRFLTLIPLSRRPRPSDFKQTLSLCQDFIRRDGRLLVSYPEGTRNTNPNMADFKRGPATLAIRLGLPVVPGYISGTDRVMPKGRLIPTCAPVRVCFGDVIDVNTVARAGNSKVASTALNSLIKERISALMGASDIGGR